MDKGNSSTKGQRPLRIGVLSLQGGVSEHIDHLEKLRQLIFNNSDLAGTEFSVIQVRTAVQLDGIDGLIIPGGETTTVNVFLQENDSELLLALRKFSKQKPIFGTCAGMIMLANEVDDQMKSGQHFIGGIDIKVCRNYYGSQKQSFEGQLTYEVEDIPDDGSKAIFIRAPGILDFDFSRVTVLAKYGHSVVAVEQDNLLATSFHPELTPNLAWHFHFFKKVVKYARATK